MALALSSSSTAPSSSFPQGATPPNFVMTPAQLTAAVLNLGQQLAGIRDLLLQRQVDDFSVRMATGRVRIGWSLRAPEIETRNRNPNPNPKPIQVEIHHQNQTRGYLKPEWIPEIRG